MTIEAVLEFALIVFGLYGVVFSAHYFLKGAVGVSHRFGVPEFVVGSVIVAIGTSAPELAINVAASLRSAGDVIASNIIGSNIVNLGLGIGLAGLLVSYRQPPRDYLSIAILGLFCAIALLMVTLLSGVGADNAVFGRWLGGGFLLAFSGFMYWSIRHSKADDDDSEDVVLSDNRLPTIFFLLAAGAVGMTFFADLTVRNAVGFASTLGVPDVIIGATIIAAGGSLPEVFSCIAAARLKRPNIVVGNIVGSQVFNILGILGASALISQFSYSRALFFDLIVLIVMTLVWIASFHVVPLRRFIGPIMLAFFTFYIAYLLRVALGG